MPGRTEFIALVAMLFATIAFSIDGMLPALPAMAEQFSPDAPNRAQFVVTSFVLGMGIGTLFTGPLSDALGRKPVVLGGAALYIAGSFLAAMAQSLEMLLLARLLQGLGAAGPRVVALAIIRDLFAGRGMAQIMSFVMMVFTIVPALAPSIGAGLIALWGWRAVFGAFILFSAISALWLALRLPETLPEEQRRPFRLALIRDAAREMAAHPMVRLSIVTQGLCFGMLFTMISTVQPIYDQAFGRADSFPMWFGIVAILAASGSFVNARLVMRLGMRRLVSRMLLAQTGLSAVMVLLTLSGLSGDPLFAAFVTWQVSVFFQAGLTLGNLNALGMEPMGHIAGLAASIIGGVATVVAVVLALPVSLAFDGTPLSTAVAILVYAVLGVGLSRRMARLEREGTGSAPITPAAP
ncbi:Bcr/CflA family efflux MFS transporter [Thetidibacter halocola]|nr:Bcr/CflA family efflux MFS transporter [Thetidibacter halocola]